MSNKNSVLQKKTRYVSGGETEVNIRSLEWWERKVFNPAQDDLRYVVEKHLEFKLPSIATMFLNDPKLWWIIAQYNNILDPVTEIYEGRVLLIPSKDKADSILDGKVGGVPSTRISPTAISPIV